MKPTLCSKCKKNLAVVFITKIENGETINEGYCLKCAKELGIKPVDDMISRMGLSDEDLESISGEMLGAMNGLEGLMANAQNQDDDTDDEDDDNASQTATFPFLNKLFGAAGNNGGNTSGEALTPQNEEPRQTPRRAATSRTGRKIKNANSSTPTARTSRRRRARESSTGLSGAMWRPSVWSRFSTAARRTIPA